MAVEQFKIGTRYRILPASSLENSQYKPFIGQTAICLKIVSGKHAYMDFDDPGVQQMRTMPGSNIGADFEWYPSEVEEVT